MASTTVKEFTNGKYKELRLTTSNGSLISGDFITTLIRMLAKCVPDTISKWSLSLETDTYDAKVEQAVFDFQKKYNITPINGIVSDDVLNAIISTSNAVSDIIYSEGALAATEGETEEDPRYDSFFSKSNTKLTRKNEQNITIELGGGTIKRTIKKVFMRSVGAEFDTSGNPISEVYEFIAQDLIESDELNDKNK